VINETHAARLFDEFTLGQTDADAGSIVLTVKSAATGSVVELTPEVHYRISTTGTSVRVRLLALPASVLGTDPFFSYTFTVTYSLNAATETIDTTAYGGSLRLDLFDHLVSPYCAYSFSRENASAGSPTGEPLDTISTTVGLTLQRLPYTLGLEYQQVRSDLNPFNRLKAEFNFRQEIGPNSQALGQALYTNTDYGEGAFQSQAYSEEVVSTSVRLQQRFPRQHLTFLVGGTYDTSSGLYRRDSFSLDGELTWVLQQLEVTASASFAKARLKLPTQDQTSEHQLYYLKMTRKLF
jgi:hypothetical protein